MLQIVLAYLAFLGLIGVAEAGAHRPVLDWFESCFALRSTAPLIARACVKEEMERGPRRTRWKKTTEAVPFSFCTISLVVLSSEQFRRHDHRPAPADVETTVHFIHRHDPLGRVQFLQSTPESTMRWVGIDEAGYGPNLGPLVMTAVVAEGPDDREPDVWGDLSGTVCRAGGASDRLWVDDSKRIYQAGKGRDRLDASTLATLAATGRSRPETLGELLEELGAGTLDDVELTPWCSGDPIYPALGSRSIAERTLALWPLDGAPWRIVDVRSVVIGPRRFNDGLANSGSKALVHFASFARLLGHLIGTTPEAQDLSIRGDKHGGRHFYGDLLESAFPDARVVRGPEGPALSYYNLIEPSGRSMTLRLVPRADADDGLVALASIVSKAVREHWMDAFNAHWQGRIPGLRATAGYPVDAARFRLAIEANCLARGLGPGDWWRSK